MILSIMQPYLFPYLGYFQLINQSNLHIIYNDVNYIKGGWINRNRVLCNCSEKYITIPVHKPSQNKKIFESFYLLNEETRISLLNQISSYYSKKPFFNETITVLSEVLKCNENRVDLFNYNSLKIICKALNIHTEFMFSSEINFSRQLKGEERILELNSKLNSTIYLNLPGGVNLYNKASFKARNIDLKFIKINDSLVYNQNCSIFSKNLSIIDVLMNVGISKTIYLLNEFEFFNGND